MDCKVFLCFWQKCHLCDWKVCVLIEMPPVWMKNHNLTIVSYLTLYIMTIYIDIWDSLWIKCFMYSSIVYIYTFMISWNLKETAKSVCAFDRDVIFYVPQNLVPNLTNLSFPTLKMLLTEMLSLKIEKSVFNRNVTSLNEKSWFDRNVVPLMNKRCLIEETFFSSSFNKPIICNRSFRTGGLIIMFSTIKSIIWKEVVVWPERQLYIFYWELILLKNHVKDFSVHLNTDAQTCGNSRHNEIPRCFVDSQITKSILPLNISLFSDLTIICWTEKSSRGKYSFCFAVVGEELGEEFGDTSLPGFATQSAFEQHGCWNYGLRFIWNKTMEKW